MAIRAQDWIAHHGAYRGDRIAVTDLFTGRRLTYRQFDERIARLARGLRSRYGIARGDRVAVLAHNSSDMFEIQFACGRLGAIFVPLNWRLTVPELQQILTDSEPSLLIHDPEFDDAAVELRAACDISHLCAHGRADSAYEHLIADSERLQVIEDTTFDDVASILYTSGTTGLPKGVMITHGMRFWQTINLTGPTRLSPESVCLTVLPLFHVGGLDVFANPVFHFGGHVVVMRAYDPPEALRLFQDRSVGITLFVGTPAHFQFVSRLPDFETAVFPDNLLAYIAAAPVPLPVLRQWEQRGLPLPQAYGMTEACGAVMMMDPDDRIPKAGTTGKPLLYLEARLARADGSPAEVGETGEIWLRGPSLSPGYWRKPEATAAAFVDGWYKSGDAGTVDADGFYRITDRWKDMYISGGENVYPAEVEEVLYQHPAISEAAVIGVADEQWGEVGRAIIVVKPDHSLTEADVMNHCQGRLARYKQPRSVVFMEVLPRNATGKVHKPTLRGQFGAA